MGDFDKPAKQKRMEKGLRKLGLTCTHGSRHDIYTCPKSGRKTNLPRHKDIKKSIVGSICEFLIKNGYSEEQIIKAFKW